MGSLRIDVAALVDIISNVAGMMIIFACAALIIKVAPVETGDDGQAYKPIHFPLSYLPRTKTSTTIIVKNGRLYRVPARELLARLRERTEKGEHVSALELEKYGVRGRIELTRTGLGFIFKYSASPDGGVPLHAPGKLKAALDQLMDDFPRERFFVMAHVWPQDFEGFRAVRAYLHEHDVEVGWYPQFETQRPRVWHVTQALNEYDTNFTSIKAQ